MTPSPSLDRLATFPTGAAASYLTRQSSQATDILMHIHFPIVQQMNYNRCSIMERDMQQKQSDFGIEVQLYWLVDLQ